MAEIVVAAAAPLDTFIVCDDDAVATWAAQQGARVIWRPGVGLNGAVTSAVEWLGAAEYERVVVAHSDLPRCQDLARLAVLPADVVLVPDHVDDGTNVIVVSSKLAFPFDYGAASYQRHRNAALALAQTITVVRDARLAHDVDRLDDLVPVKEMFPWLPTNLANRP